jgi:hypothetical protein
MIIRLLFQLVFFFLTVAAQAAGGGRFADENGNEQVVETTDSHPFWVVNKDARVEARNLREGDVFIGTNGELSTLVEKERVEYPAEITVYNFTVDGNHDYFVIAQTAELGQTSVLVHNANYSIKGRLTDAELPTKGKIRFVPPKGYNPVEPLRRGEQGGYIDRFGNELVKGPSRTAGQAFEWDVQLPANLKGNVRFRLLSKDGQHVNVTLDGRISH